MGFKLSTKHCACWRCGGHNTIAVIAEITGTSFAQARLLLDDIEKHTIAVEDLRGKLVLPKGLSKLQQPHKRYLNRRGFSFARLVKRWNIQGIGMAANLSWRIFIPIYYRGTLVSWTTRSIGDSGLRYMSAKASEEIINHKHLLYGEDYASHTIIIFEGPTDVWRVGLGAVATLGITFSKQQVTKMARRPIRYVCFDNEPVAQQRAEQLCDMLSLLPGKTYNITLDSNDAACAKDREIRKLRKLLQK